MKKRRFIGWLIGAALMASMSSCSDDKDFIAPKETMNPVFQKYSTILLNVTPGSPALTRVDVGEVSPLEIDERIYSIKVWAFLSANQTARTVSYTSLDGNGNPDTATKTTQTPEALQMADYVDNPIAYVEYENATGTVDYQQLQLSIPSVVLENFWKIDLYATCNSQSYLAKTEDNPMGEITYHAKRQEIEAAIIKHDEGQEDADRQDPFGVTNPMRGSQSFAEFKGIPMSYIQKNIDFYNEQTPLESNIVYDSRENRYDFNRDYVQDIHLQHIVSKFRFVFTRTIGTVTNAEITKIELGLLDNDGTVKVGAFPTVEYLMPKMDTDNPNVMATRVTNIGTNYENAIITFEGENGAAVLSIDDIMETQNVYQYMATVDAGGNLYVNDEQMTAQQYDDLILGASYDAESTNSTTEGKELTMFGRTWIRETDKQLGGKIYYKINGEEKTATFQMAQEGDFSRNHSWIIYAYFVEGELYVKPTVIPWIAGMDRLTYVTKGSTKMEFEPNTEYLRYDPDDLSSWKDSYTCVAYGYTDFGMPLYSPKVILKTEHDYDLQLQLNNIDFEIVVFDADTNTYSHEGDLYTIPANDGNPQTTTIWVVPTSNNMPSDVNASLMLTLLRPEDPYAVPYNHELPGNESHTTIKYRYINADRYTTLMNMNPIDEDYYEKMIIR